MNDRKKIEKKEHEHKWIILTDSIPYYHQGTAMGHILDGYRNIVIGFLCEKCLKRKSIKSV